jgi:hypothetical protein
MMLLQLNKQVEALTCMHNMHYNVGTMNTSLQITIRGLDQTTKDALVKKAGQRGVSLNQYALRALQQSAGVDDSEARYQAMKQFFKVHHMSKGDKQAFDDAIAWSDKASLEKQRKEERDNSI